MAIEFSADIKFIKGVGPKRAELLKKELNIHSFGDLMSYFPYRYEDRTRVYKISELLGNEEVVQLHGKVTSFKTIGHGRKARLNAEFNDGTGTIELVWFKGINWVLNKIKPGKDYILLGKPSIFSKRLNIAHPELQLKENQDVEVNTFLTPLYSTTEKLRKSYLDSRAIQQIIQSNLDQLPAMIENLPQRILKEFRLQNKKDALMGVHLPKDLKVVNQAQRRLKFEELFFIQLKIIEQKQGRKDTFPGQVFKRLISLQKFYEEIIPFELTEAQKKVIREIRNDIISGKQMNRLLQGDVGSGKTIVAFLCALMAKDNKAQSCLMAPTEILAEQHYQGLIPYCEKLGVRIEKLSGSTKASKRNVILEDLENGLVDIIVGTHALIEERVKFRNLGLCIIDEQHRFGVAQRAKLWQKNKDFFPHILVMTATPIPRTLAMTLYGDLDISVIDELPPGRKAIKTVHRKDAHRLQIFKFLKEQIELGRQVYIVYPLIEESKKLDYKDLMDGYESVSRAFPDYPIGILHGKMKSDDKDFEMQRFVKGETKILVSTTVIEVGVNVPNASVMVIENAEKFGLSQLHQLRGRVGRGADQSYCILISGEKLSKDGKVRLDTMVRTQNGFEIADVDLQLRGPGDLSGTQQSGVLEMKIANLARDSNILQSARNAVIEIFEEDPNLEKQEHQRLRSYLKAQKGNSFDWKLIS